MAAQVRGAVQVRFAAQVTGRVTVQLGVAAQVEAQVGGGSGTGYRARRGLCTGMPGSSLVRWLFIWSFALLFLARKPEIGLICNSLCNRNGLFLN